MMDIIYHTPQNMPDLVLNMIFFNLELPDIFNCMFVCKNWYRVISFDSAKHWKLMCHRQIPEELHKSELLSSLHSYKFKLRALYHSWNPKDCSKNIFIKPDGFTLHRNPVSNYSDLARAKIGYSSGKHIWEITWTQPLGTDSLVGLSTKYAQKQCRDYLPLLGINNQSWGWNLSDNVLYHNSENIGKYPLTEHNNKYQIGEKLRLVLDSENGTLHFEKCNEFLGIAFRNLPKTKLYPSISTTYGNTEITIVYIGEFF